MTDAEWGSIEWFNQSEITDPGKVSFELMKQLDAYRDYIDKSIFVTSSTGGKHASNSQHYLGKAVDIIIPKMRIMDAYLSAERFGFNGIGIYSDWKYDGHNWGGLHLDVREEHARWIGFKTLEGERRYLSLTANNLQRTGIVLK